MSTPTKYQPTYQEQRCPHCNCDDFFIEFSADGVADFALVYEDDKFRCGECGALVTGKQLADHLSKGKPVNTAMPPKTQEQYSMLEPAQ